MSTEKTDLSSKDQGQTVLGSMPSTSTRWFMQWIRESM